MKTEKRKDVVCRRLYGIVGASLIALATLSSCSKDATLDEQVDNGKKDYLMLVPDFVGVNDAPKTMGLVDPNFTGNMVLDMGLFICDNNATYPSNVYHPHQAGYLNMEGRCNAYRVSSGDEVSFDWLFTPSNTTVPLTGTGVPLLEGATVDVYAYAPYSPGSVTNPKQIPFVASQSDFMWATPVMGASSGTVNLALKHAMTCFSFKIFSLKMGNVVLKQIKMVDKSGTHLVTSGTFDVTTGDINNRIYASVGNPLYATFDSKIQYLYTSSGLDRDCASFDVIVPSINNYNSNDIEITLVLSSEDSGGVEFLSDPITIPVSSASYEGGKHLFKRGFRYIYSIDVDNYTKFKPLGFEEWSVNPDQIINIEI